MNPTAFQKLVLLTFFNAFRKDFYRFPFMEYVLFHSSFANRGRSVFKYRVISDISKYLILLETNYCPSKFITNNGRPRSLYPIVTYRVVSFGSRNNLRAILNKVFSLQVGFLDRLFISFASLLNAEHRLRLS